jgi:ATP-dependent Clp protease ATP-binding subunit ClpA
VAGIIGVPAGYVGHDQGGRLINDLNADPYGVFLLDEADKAHPDVLQPFLNLFDEGWIRDQRGSLAHADKSIFILTTNVGQRMIADMVREGKSMADIAARMKEALSQIRHTKTDRPVFTPEFLARIKRLIVFRPLDRQGMAGISRKLAAEMRESWQQRRGKDIEIAEAVMERIADKAHELNERSQGKEGGRIVRKLLADLVEAKIQAAISRRPDEYRDAAAVAVDLNADESVADPDVTVRFSR